jgi:hypothetical protein
MKKGQLHLVVMLGIIISIIAAVGASYFLLVPFLSTSADVVAKNFALTMETAASAPKEIEISTNIPTKTPLEVPSELQQFNYIVNTFYFTPDRPRHFCVSGRVTEGCDDFSSEGNLIGNLKRTTACYPVRLLRDSGLTLFGKTYDLEFARNYELNVYLQKPYFYIKGDEGDLIINTESDELVEEVDCTAT